VGGLGSLVAEVAGDHQSNCRVVRLGIDEIEPRVGSGAYMRARHRLDRTSLVHDILASLERPESVQAAGEGLR
jgi:transketolase C-terminal domain/subunit